MDLNQSNISKMYNMHQELLSNVSPIPFLIFTFVSKSAKFSISFRPLSRPSWKDNTVTEL